MPVLQLERRSSEQNKDEHEGFGGRWLGGNARFGFALNVASGLNRSKPTDAQSCSLDGAENILVGGQYMQRTLKADFCEKSAPKIDYSQLPGLYSQLPLTMPARILRRARGQSGPHRSSSAACCSLCRLADGTVVRG